MKKTLDYIPGHLLVFYILGILFQYNTNFELDFFLAVFSIGVLLLIASVFRKLFFLVYVTAFFLGITAVDLQQNPRGDFKFYVNNSNSVVISIATVLKSNSYSERYYGKVLEVNSKKASGSILVSIEKDSLKGVLNIGDEIIARAIFQEVKKPRNPYSFNYKEYLKTKNISYQLTLRKGTWLVVSKGERSLKSIAETFRNKLLLSLEKNIKDKDVLAITEAMLLGQRKHISKELKQEYTDAGVVHILAVSGLHVGILVLILSFLLQPLTYLKNGKIVKLVFLILFLWSFAFLAGLSASVVRSVTMFSFVTVGMVFNNKTTIFYALITSAFLLLLIHPFYLFDIGFQMSYLAVFSIVLVQPLIYEFWNPKFKVLDYFWKLTSVSVAAQLGVLPISLFYFHQFPSLFIITNLVVIPLIGIVLLFGIVVLIFSFFNALPKWLAEIYSMFISSLNFFIQKVSEQEQFIWKAISFSSYKMISCYLLILSFIFLLYKKTWRSLSVVLIGVVVFQGVCIYEKTTLMKLDTLVVFHQYKESAMLIVSDGKGEAFSTNKGSIEDEIQDYEIGTGLGKIEIKDTFKNVYVFKNNQILVVDGLGIYKLSNFKNGMVLLRNSPSINLERLISHLKPKIIIVDGSNYKYKIDLWKKTCFHRNIEFYNTAEQGAFILN